MENVLSDACHDEFLKQWKWDPVAIPRVTAIRFRLSTSDLTGLAIESSKPKSNPDWREGRKRGNYREDYLWRH